MGAFHTVATVARLSTLEEFPLHTSQRLSSSFSCKNIPEWSPHVERFTEDFHFLRSG